MVSGPGVVLADGDDASGMACMLADLITDNLNDYPARALVARRARGDVVFTTTDHGVAVTLSFRGGRVEITDGVMAGAPVIEAPWMTMAALCSGRSSPLKARCENDLSVTLNRRPVPVAAAAYVVSVPGSHYGKSSNRARTALVLAAGVCLVASFARSRRRRTRVSQVRL